MDKDVNSRRQLSLSSYTSTLTEISSVWGFRVWLQSIHFSQVRLRSSLAYSALIIYYKSPQGGKTVQSWHHFTPQQKAAWNQMPGSHMTDAPPWGGAIPWDSRDAGWLCCTPASEPNRHAGRERWRPEHPGGDTLWAASAPCQIEPQFSSCPVWQQPFLPYGGAGFGMKLGSPSSIINVKV